jgi:hypothetical protein
LKIRKDASSTGGVHSILIRYSILYTSVSHKVKEEFEDIKGVNRRRRDNNMARRKRTKGQTTIYKILHRKLKISQHEPL